MSRLIDADLLMRKCEKWLKPKTPDGDEMVSLADIAVSMLMEIEEQQTAFDVEKVIEQLNKELELADEEKRRCTIENMLQFDEAKGYARGMACAIEIVKRGGRDEEKYAKEIVELACNKSDIAVSKATGNPIYCNNIKCDCCALYKGGIYNDYTCVGALEKWAESECIETQAISKSDRAFLDYILEKYKYIVRSSSGTLFAYTSKPIKSVISEFWYGISLSLSGLVLDFPMVKWEDEEPWLIEDLKKLEVVDSYE